MNWIGYRVLDSLITYPDAWFLSRTAFPIQNEGQWIGAPIDGLLTPPRASSTPAQHTNNLSPWAQRDHNLQRTMAPRPVLLRCEATNLRCTPQTRRRPGPAPARPCVTRASHGRIWSSPPARTQRAYKTRPDQPVRARNVFGSGVRTLAVVRAVLTTIATLTTPLRHVILLGFVV